MGDVNWKQVAMPLFLLVIMVLSVVGLSYTPGVGNQGSNPGTGDVPDSFTYNGYDFEYVTVGGQQILQTTLNGQTVQFRSRPQSVSRFEIPDSFGAMIQNTSTVEVVAPAATSGQNGQARYVSEQLANQISQRTSLTATATTEESPSCTDTPRIRIIPGETDALLEATGQDCYTTSTTDQGIFILSDYLVYKTYGIL